MAKKRDLDLFVIGAGSGGVRAARMAAAAGARVAVCEDSRLGGTCVNRGCIPKKLYVYASAYSEMFEDAEAYGWSKAKHSFDWKTLVAAKDKEITRLNGVYGRLLSDAGVETVRGRGTLEDAHTVRVGEKTWTAENILIATGGTPIRPEIEGSDLAITSDDAFDLAAFPRRIVIVGGGYIALEFATIFNGLGAEVVLMMRGERPLRGFDEDVRRFLHEELEKKGIEVRPECFVAGLKREGGRLRAATTSGDSILADQAMFAIGRQPNTHGLGLDALGVELTRRGAVSVDHHSRSTVPHIWAIGDATDRIALTPVALHEAMCLVKTLFGGEPTTPDHREIATAVFTRPEVASVGLGEEEARAEYGRIDVYRSTFRPLMHTLTGRDEKTLMKLVVKREGGRVLGCHMVGDHAAEIVQGLAIAVKAGLTKADFDRTVGIHPSAAEEFVTMRTPVPEPQRKAAE